MSLADFAGGRNLHFFKILPPWINPKERPGRSEFATPTFSDFIWNAIFQTHLWASPNLVWLLLTIGTYILFPYDLSASSNGAKAPVNFDFFKERFPIWFTLVFGYVLFWHVTLYWCKWADRPFIPNRAFRWSKVIHNFYYNIWAVVIFVVIENMFVFLWSTKRWNYLADATVWSSSPLLHLHFFFWVSVTPLWRDFHFYIAHRILHTRGLYTYCHALHHRNTDIAPEAGLCMHLIEHFYYYCSVLTSMVFVLSPFHLLWNGVHLLLAPAASHSGYEDHFQADGFHYMHHRYFECNYAGLSAAFCDAWGGSFRAKWPEAETKTSNKKKKKNHDADDDDQQEAEDPIARHDAKATLFGLPSIDHILYWILSLGCIAVAIGAMNRDPRVVTKLSRVFGGSQEMAMSVAPWIGGCGPTVAAVMLDAMFSSQRTAGRVSGTLEGTARDKTVFHQIVHFVLGVLFCPVALSYLFAACSQ